MPLATIGKIVDPGGLYANQRVEDPLGTNCDGFHMHRGDMPEAVGDMLCVPLLSEIAFKKKRPPLTLHLVVNAEVRLYTVVFCY